MGGDAQSRVLDTEDPEGCTVEGFKAVQSNQSVYPGRRRGRLRKQTVDVLGWSGEVHVGVVCN